MTRERRLERQKERKREIRAYRKAMGLCVRCGKEYVVNSALDCEICVLKKASQKCFGTSDYYKDLPEIFIAQKMTCAYTGIKLFLGGNASIDHIACKASGGTNDRSNLEWVHKWINPMKETYTKSEFLQMLPLFVDDTYHHLKKLHLIL